MTSLAGNMRISLNSNLRTFGPVCWCCVLTVTRIIRNCWAGGNCELLGLVHDFELLSVVDYGSAFFSNLRCRACPEGSSMSVMAIYHRLTARRGFKMANSD